jgi:hypothetical protein
VSVEGIIKKGKKREKGEKKERTRKGERKEGNELFTTWIPSTVQFSRT